MLGKPKAKFLQEYMPALGVLAAGILLSVISFVLMRGLESRSLERKFKIDAENYSAALKKNIKANLNSLHAVEGLYASSPHVTRARFKAFAASILSETDAVHALRWVQRVPGPERKKYEQAAARDGLRNYHFFEMNSERQRVSVPKREEYFPIYFSEPAEGSEAILGLDLYAKAERKAFLDKARDTGEQVASRRIILRYEKDPRFSFVVFHPIYRNGLPHDTVEERRRNLMGYAAGVFRFDDIVDAALKGINLKGIEISLWDKSAPPEKAALYSNVSQNNPSAGTFQFAKDIVIADREWTVQFYPTARYLSSNQNPYVWTVLAAGLMFSILLALYVFIVKRHAFEMERSTETLATVLNSIDAAISIVDSKDMKILAWNDAFASQSKVGKDEIAGRPCFEVVQKHCLPCTGLCRGCPAEAARAGEHASREVVVSGGEGEVRHIELSGYPVKDETKSVRQVVLVAQDVTARKLAENARLEEQHARRMSAERQLVETQVKMLQAQIEPHFLFNTLATVISLIDREPKSAKQMLQHITASLRLSLRRSREDVSTLGQEAEMLRDYLSIFKLRLGRRLDFRIDIPAAMRDLSFPPMLLQPLVENAVIHGIEPKVEGGRIEIKAEKADGRLRIIVSDTGLGFSDTVSSPGVGLENVRTRLRALYNESACLILEENAPTGAIAAIEVPL